MRGADCTVAERDCRSNRAGRGDGKDPRQAASTVWRTALKRKNAAVSDVDASNYTT
jgi:hypothetical protein